MSPRVTGSEKRVEVTDQDNDVTTSIAGANGFETVFDLSPDTDIYYLLYQGDHPKLGSQGNPRLRLTLPQEGGGSTEISDDAKIRIIKQGPEEEDVDQLGQEFRYRRFSQADQFDEEDVVRMNLNRTVGVAEAGHLKIQVDNSTAGNDVDLSQTGGFVSVDLHRGVER